MRRPGTVFVTRAWKDIRALEERSNSRISFLQKLDMGSGRIFDILQLPGGLGLLIVWSQEFETFNTTTVGDATQSTNRKQNL